MKIKTMDVDDLVTQGARASAAITLIWFSKNNLGSKHEELKPQLLVNLSSQDLQMVTGIPT